MKIIIFTGGPERRLWPVSRAVSPNQLESIVDSKSTIQLTVNRVLETYGAENIFVSTNERYMGALNEQLPMLPKANFILEPARRDLAAAVGLANMHMLHCFGPVEPIAIIWGDNYVTEEPTMTHAYNFALISTFLFLIVKWLQLR